MVLEFKKAYVYENAFVAPVLRGGVSVAKGPRYALLRGDGKRDTSCAFILQVKDPAKGCLFVVTAARRNKSVAFEGLHVSRDDSGRISLQRRDWHTVAGVGDTAFWAVIRPGLHPLLGQGHCSMHWGKARASARALGWKAVAKQAKLPSSVCNLDKAPLEAIPLAMNNQAVLLAEQGKVANAVKRLEEADSIARMIGLRTDLRAVLWLNSGLLSYVNDRLKANQFWRRSTVYPKEYVGIAGVLSQLVRRRMEALQVEAIQDMGRAMLVFPKGQTVSGPVAALQKMSGYGSSSVIKMETLPLKDKARRALSKSVPVGIALLPDSVLFAFRNKGVSGHLLRVKIEDGSVLGQWPFPVPGGRFSLRATSGGAWAFENDGDVTYRPWQGKAVKVNGPSRLAREVRGGYFDGKTWWALTVGRPGLTGTLPMSMYTLDMTAKRYRKVYDFSLPKTVKRVVGLGFAAPGGCDIYVEEELDMAKAGKDLNKLISAYGESFVMSSGGTARLALLQLRECAKKKAVRYTAVYRLWDKKGRDADKGVLRKSVLKDYSGMPYGFRGEAGDVVGLLGISDVTTVLATRQPVGAGEGDRYSLLLVDRLHQVRAIVPVYAAQTHPATALPLAATFGRIAYLTDHRQVVLVEHATGDAWRPPGPDTYWPSAAHPIILKNGRLLFGGKSGTERKTMNWASPLAFKTVSRGGKLAAVVFSREKETVVQVLDPQKKTVKTIQLAKENRTASISVGDSGHVLARIGPPPKEMTKLLHRSMYSKTHVDVPSKWFFFGTDGKRHPVDLKGWISTVVIFANGKWVTFAYDPDSDSFMLSMWREGQRLWSKKIRKKKKNSTGWSMAVAGRDPPLIVVITPDGVREYDLEGRDVTAKDHQKTGAKE